MTDDTDLSQINFWSAASLYLHSSRWHSFRQRMGVSLATERIVEVSDGVEGGVSGGLFGIMSGSSKITGGNKTSTKVSVPEEELINEACRKATLSLPPDLFVIAEAEDWAVVTEGQLILVEGIFTHSRRDSDQISQKRNNGTNFELHGICREQDVLVKGSWERIRPSSEWNDMSYGHSFISCIGLLLTQPTLDEYWRIEPMMIGRTNIRKARRL